MREERHGDGEKGRHGDAERDECRKSYNKSRLFVAASPLLCVAASPRLPVAASPLLPVTVSFQLCPQTIYSP